MAANFLPYRPQVKSVIAKWCFSPQDPNSFMRFKQFKQISNQTDERFSHHHHNHGNDDEIAQRKKPHHHKILQFSGPEMVLMSIHRCHLKRSNAIRVREKNFDILPASVRKSILAFHSASRSCETSPISQLIQAGICGQQQGRDLDENDTVSPATEFSLCDQIKQGVVLHPAGPHNFHCNENRKKCREEPEESLADLLAKVLAKRHSVMQQTDDESEPSSINSQPEQYDDGKEDEGSSCSQGDNMNATEADTSVGNVGSHCDEHPINHASLMDVVSVVVSEHGNGRIELIAHL